MRWLRRWYEIWKLARMAKAVLADNHFGPASDMASAKARAILAAIAERRPICRHCFNPYIPHERPFAEMFQLRSILLIPDREPDPMLCDSCFNIAVTSYNPQATVPGTSNSGPTNLVLQKLH